ncbi:unnamed protein product [Allacma fusca]|uniref:Uncharacterized protein n=1 Tax=Allacma fusca TaxID=39272 RepID=A0A8J2PFJ4_9HEXA|nr:unnamed protein product [Allacma fusca]
MLKFATGEQQCSRKYRAHVVSCTLALLRAERTRSLALPIILNPQFILIHCCEKWNKNFVLRKDFKSRFLYSDISRK